MKNLMAFIALALISTGVLAAPVKTVKVADGTTAYCRNSHDAYRYRVGAYTLKGLNASIEDGQIKIIGKIGFLKCSKDANGKFSFIKVGAYHTFNYQTVVSRDEQFNVQVRTEDVILRSYVDGKYAKISDSKISARNDSEIEIKMDLNTVLTAEQMRSLSAGEPVKTAVDSFILKTLVFENQEGSSMRDRMAFGSFRFFIELSDCEGMVKARILK